MKFEYSCNGLPDDLGSSYADVFCIDLVLLILITGTNQICLITDNIVQASLRVCILIGLVKMGLLDI